MQRVTMGSHMHTNIYAHERAREMELAGSERQMGCSPLCRMISEVVKKCNARKRWRKEKLDYAMAYPHAQTCYVRPTASTVAYTTSAHPPNTHAIPPAQPPQVHGPFGPTAAAPPGAGGKPRKRKKKSNHVRFNTAAGPVYAGSAPPPNAAGAYHHASAAGTSGDGEAAYGDQRHHHHAAASHAYSPAPQGHGQGYGYGRYAPSPLTRWEMLGAAGTPRRHEYFSGEYRWCYPTPVREGIYSMATDANRLTAIFSEENPNACTIV